MARKVISSATVLQYLTICFVLAFIAVQFNMLFSGTACSDRVKVLLENERKWSSMARELKANLSHLQEELQSAKNSEKSALEDLAQLKGTTNVALKQQQKQQQQQQHQDGLALTQEGEQKSAIEKVIDKEQRQELQKAEEKEVKLIIPKLRGQFQQQEEREREKEKEKKDGAKRPKHGAADAVAAVVVMAYNRPDYLERTITSILKKHQKSFMKFPLFISQDGTHPGVKRLAEKNPSFHFMQHVAASDPEMNSQTENIAYYKIARHYEWALTQLFDKMTYERVIILEDDMEISVDFFDYFEATSALLDTDESILAISSWNDNGQIQFVRDPELLYRSDFFPGLGWMLRQELWRELKPKWPKAYWDDWLRLEVNRKSRQTICPEICRTYNFGAQGSSFGQYFSRYLEPIKLNNVSVNWASKDLSYLLDVTYPPFFDKQVKAARRGMTVDAVLREQEMAADTVISYSSQAEFVSIARQFGIFEEWKDGVPRTGYQMIVSFRFRGPHRVFLVRNRQIRLGVRSN